MIETTLFLLNLDKIFDYSLSHILTKYDCNWVFADSLFPLLLQNYTHIVSLGEIPKKTKDIIHKFDAETGCQLKVTIVNRPDLSEASLHNLDEDSELRAEQLAKLINLSEEDYTILLALDGYFNIIREREDEHEEEKVIRSLYATIQPKLVHIYKKFATDIYGCSSSVIDQFIGTTVDNLSKTNVMEISMFKAADASIPEDDLDMDLGGPDYLPIMANGLVNLMLPTILQSSICYRDVNGLMVIGLKPLMTEKEFNAYERALSTLEYSRIGILRNSWTMIANK